MDLLSLSIVTGGLLLYSLVSGRLIGTVVTAPMVFVAFGFLIGPGGLNVADVSASHSVIHTIAELTLVLVLFTDAARIDLKQVRRDHDLPMRMLVIGLPLAVILGAWVAVMLFPDFSLWEAALLAALLAPTDAALGQAVVSDKAVPTRIRQAINIESGLNDGIVLPAVLLFAALALASSHHGTPEAGDWLRFGLLQVTLGPLVGIAIGYAGARLLDTAAESGWAGTSFQGIGILSLALFSFVAAELSGGNGFISAFVAGMVFGNTLRHPCVFLFEFMETQGQLLMLITFTVFGAALLPEVIGHITPTILLYAVLSLTFIRIIPVGVSLLGAGLRFPTPLFLGWFGPRGLASILFVLLILEEAALPHSDELFATTVVTVALSTLLHGVSAAPLAKLYGRLTESMGECEENQSVAELPLREGMRNTSEPLEATK